MIYFTSLDELKTEDACVLSLGKFDGLHRGHETLMEYMKQKKKEGLKSAIFTFDIPPKSKVEHASDVKVLTTKEEKRSQLEAEGVDYLVECPFTDEVMHLSPEQFVEKIVTGLNVKSMVVGEDFHFGYQRKGNPKLLSELAEVYGYELKIEKKLQYENEDISSTRVRAAIEDGNLLLANTLLGFPFFIEGIISYGNQIGRTIGIPTANILVPEEKLMPHFGVYQSTIEIDGIIYEGIANVGRKPTIKKEGLEVNPIGVEVHIFDFNQNVYNKKARVSFQRFVRPERKFESVEALKEQMQRDIQAVRESY